MFSCDANWLQVFPGAQTLSWMTHACQMLGFTAAWSITHQRPLIPASESWSSVFWVCVSHVAQFHQSKPVQVISPYSESKTPAASHPEKESTDYCCSSTFAARVPVGWRHWYWGKCHAVLLSGRGGPHSRDPLGQTESRGNHTACQHGRWVPQPHTHTAINKTILTYIILIEAHWKRAKHLLNFLGHDVQNTQCEF